MFLVPVVLKEYVFLLHRDCLGRTLVDAGLTFYAEIGINFCFPVYHGYGVRRADIHAGLTTGTLLNINYCWHFFLLMYMSFQ